MGRLPRKCELRGPCGDPVGTLPGPRTFRRGLIGKIRQIPAKFALLTSEQNLTSFIFLTSDVRTKFGQNLAKIC